MRWLDVHQPSEGRRGPIGCRVDARVGVSCGSRPDFDGSGHGEVKPEFLPCVVLARTTGQGGNSCGCSSRQGDKNQGRHWETW